MSSDPTLKGKVPPPWEGKSYAGIVLVLFFALGFAASVATAFVLVSRMNDKEKSLSSLFEQNQELKQNNELLGQQISQLRADNQNKSSDLRSQAQEVQEKKQMLERLMEADKKRRAYESKIQELSDQASGGLDKVLAGADFNVTHKGNEIVIRLSDKIFFKSGDANLKPESQKVLQSIATLLNGSLKEAFVRVEGNTDSTPVGAKSRYASNWELSAIRATSATRFLEQEGKVDPKRLSAVGRGSTNPLVPEKSDDDAAKNRRIELILTLPPYVPDASAETTP